MRLRTRGRPDGERRDDRSLRTSPRKGILICPECGHESHVDDDWAVDESTDRTDYACPVCGCVVVSQPVF